MRRTGRDAVAIQLILPQEYGWLRNEDPLQESFVADFLTDEVEEQILSIFEEMNNRGGVLGSLEVNDQRNRIQDERPYLARETVLSMRNHI